MYNLSTKELWTRVSEWRSFAILKRQEAYEMELLLAAAKRHAAIRTSNVRPSNILKLQSFLWLFQSVNSNGTFSHLSTIT